MDCLEGMKQLSSNSIDLVVTDPPYNLSTSSAYGDKCNPWGDICNSSYWFSALFKEYLRILKPSGCVWNFTNWRSLPILQKAAFDIGRKLEDVMVWDKVWIGPGGCNGLRPRYELVTLIIGDDFKIEDRGIPDMFECLWSGKKPTGHPAEKPVKLLKHLISISGGGVVCDPFMGSGSTAVAAKELGCDFVGFELDSGWIDIANKRLSQSHIGFLDRKSDGLIKWTKHR